MAEVRCPICGKATTFDGPPPERFPFCSDRCKWVDLGRWLQGEYHLEREVDPEELADTQPFSTDTES